MRICVRFNDTYSLLCVYNNLSSVEKQYVDDLRHEAAMDEYDSHCGEEL